MTIDELKASVSMEEVIEYYGAVIPPHSSGKTSIECPFHDDTRPSASVDLDTDRFHCFVGCVSGDILDVVQWAEQLDSVRDTIDVIGEMFLSGR